MQPARACALGIHAGSARRHRRPGRSGRGYPMRIPGNGPRRSGWRLRRSLLVFFGAAALAVIPQTFAAASETDWSTYGYDPANTRNQPFEHDISTANARQLALKWVATTTGDVSGTPAVVERRRLLRRLRRHRLEARREHRRGDLVALRPALHRASPATSPARARRWTATCSIVGTNKTPLLLGHRRDHRATCSGRRR